MPLNHRVLRVAPTGAPKTLEVEWADGTTDTVDLTGLIARSSRLGALEDKAVFDAAEPIDWGSGIGWPNGLDYGADTLRRLAEEQRPMAGAALREAFTALELSVQESADLLGVALSTMKNYLRAKRVPTHVAIAARALARDQVALAAHYRPRKPGRPRKTA